MECGREREKKKKQQQLERETGLMEFFCLERERGGGEREKN